MALAAGCGGAAAAVLAFLLLVMWLWMSARSKRRNAVRSRSILDDGPDRESQNDCDMISPFRTNSRLVTSTDLSARSNDAGKRVSGFISVALCEENVLTVRT